MARPQAERPTHQKRWLAERATRLEQIAELYDRLDAQFDQVEAEFKLDGPLPNLRLRRRRPR